jgi:rhomboid protease GluP
MVFAGLGLVSFKGSDLLNWGANFRPLTTDGQWWRLLTSTFLHGGLMHILANMFGLLFVGIFLEPLLGKTKYALVYLVTGILASVASIWW